MREIAWVIENDCMGPPVHYFCGGRGGKSFSRDHMEAIRFTRREDALQALTFFVRHPVQDCCEVREHVWLSPHQAPDAEQGAVALKAVRDVQAVLAEYIIPDSGISETECVNRLLGILDHQDLVRALRSPTQDRG